jgi:hypothetical protein
VLFPFKCHLLHPGLSRLAVFSGPIPYPARPESKDGGVLSAILAFIERNWTGGRLSLKSNYQFDRLSSSLGARSPAADRTAARGFRAIAGRDCRRSFIAQRSPVEQHGGDQSRGCTDQYPEQDYAASVFHEDCVLSSAFASVSLVSVLVSGPAMPPQDRFPAIAP